MEKREGLLQNKWVIYGVAASFLPKNRKAGSEEPAIHGIISKESITF